MFFILILLILLRPFFSYTTSFWPTLFFSLLLLVFLSLYILRNKLNFKKIKSLWLPLLLLILTLGISINFSNNFILSIGVLHNYIIYFLIFFISASLSKIQKKQIINIIILCSIIISILSIIHYFLGMDSFFRINKKYDLNYDFSIIYIQNKRAFFPLSTPNLLAGFLIICIPFMLDKKKLYPLLLLISFNLFLSKSIGALISLLIGLIFYFYLKGERYPLKIIKIISLTIIIILIIFLIRYKTSLELNLFLSLRRRFDYLKETFKIIKMHPFVGSGLGNFKLGSTRYTHNLLFQIWAEIGILGLVSFIWFIILVFKCAFLNFKNNNEDKTLFIQLITSNVIFLLHNLIDFTFFIPEVSFFWWAILGMNI